MKQVEYSIHDGRGDRLVASRSVEVDWSVNFAVRQSCEVHSGSSSTLTVFETLVLVVPGFTTRYSQHQDRLGSWIELRRDVRPSATTDRHQRVFCTRGLSVVISDE